MKLKTRFFILFVFLMTIIFGDVAKAAESNSATLEKAEINIISDGDVGYEVTQKITINNVEELTDGSIEHTLSSINNVEISNLKVVSDGHSLEFTTEESKALDRYFVTAPENSSGNFTYTITYELMLKQGEFTVPIFVPLVPSQGKGNIVAINFTTAEGKIIQRNSFPVLKKSEKNEVTSYLMNVPSHVNYIFGDTKKVFTLFNFVGWTSIAVLVLIVSVWIRSELKAEKEVAN
ncbi:hypothetical protein [Sporosarcina koreensis]|uniref:Uncharacterized protein n=1 Tax=Sporosarcina koreensis TaxID=334735 RepID=A0ABW0U3P3_9BACL